MLWNDREVAEKVRRRSPKYGLFGKITPETTPNGRVSGKVFFPSATPPPKLFLLPLRGTHAEQKFMRTYHPDTVLGLSLV